MLHRFFAALLVLWLPCAAAQNCKGAPGPIVLDVPAAPTSLDVIEIGAGKLGLLSTAHVLEVQGLVVNVTLKGTLVDNDSGPVRCSRRSIGPLAAGTYEVRLHQAASNAQPSVSLVTTKQMVVAEAGRPVWATVLPSYPTPDKPLSIRIRAATPGSPSVVFAHHATVSDDVVRIDGCVGDLGFSVPGLYVFAVGVPPLPAGHYRVEYRRATCRNDTGEVVAAPQFMTSFGIHVKHPGAGWPGPDAPVMPVTEYYHEGFDHAFITADEDEQVALDSRQFAGWELTTLDTFSPVAKYGFYREAGRPHTTPVCRFFSASFAPKSSHFYTADPAECERVKSNADWIYEGVVGHVVTYGFCDGSVAPLFRLYNNGRGGAPSHRYTTLRYQRDYYVGAGWTDEGVLGCVPVFAPPYSP